MSAKDEKRLRQQAEQDRARILGEGGAATAQATARGNELYPGVKSGFEQLAQTGGINEGQFAPWLSGYQNFAQTGGISPIDIANIRSRSASVIPGIYNRMGEQLRQHAARSGGYSPGFGANIAMMGRNVAQLGAENARDTELGISDLQRQGRQFGLAGGAGLTSNINAMRQRGIMGGIGGLGNLYGGEQQNALAERGLTESSLGNLYGPQMQLATRPGAFSNIMRGIGTAASFAMPFGGMLSKIGHGGGIPAYDPNAGVPMAGSPPPIPSPSFNPFAQ